MSRADQRKFHYIYKITRVETGRFYIGMHSTDDLDDGYFGSGKIITASIKKHGIDAHVKEIIEQLPSREALKLREKELVNEELIGNKLCMNLVIGGNGGWSKEASLKGVASLREKLKSDKNFAKKFSEASRANMIKTRNEGKFKNNKGFGGLKHSEDTKQKMRNFAIGTQIGEKNSQFGTCWVIKNEKPIKISIFDLPQYLNDGYRRGRK